MLERTDFNVYNSIQFNLQNNNCYPPVWFSFTASLPSRRLLPPAGVELWDSGIPLSVAYNDHCFRDNSQDESLYDAGKENFNWHINLMNMVLIFERIFVNILLSFDRFWHCSDRTHVGYKLTQQYADMLLNAFCGKNIWKFYAPWLFHLKYSLW